MNKKNKILVSILITLVLILINSKAIYGKVSSTDYRNVEPGSTVKIYVKAVTPTEDATVTMVSHGGLGKPKIGGPAGAIFNDDSGMVTISSSSGFTGEIGNYTFKVPEGYGKQYNVRFSVITDSGVETTTAVVSTKAEPKKEEPKKEEPKKSSEEISKKDVANSNKIAVEKAIDTTKANKSSNNYLKNISTSLGTLSPAFNRSQTSYILSFPYDFDYKTLGKISINASKEDSKEKVEGIGTKEVKVGTNVYNLVVTAENGETKTYTIKLIKPEISEDKNMRLSTLKLSYTDENGNNVELPLDKTFNAETLEYSLNVSNIVKAIKVDTTLPDGSDGIKVSVSGNEDLQDGENVITITLSNENADTENPKKTVYTIKVNKAAAVAPEVAITEQSNKAPEKKLNFKLIIGVILGIILLLIITLIILLIVSKKQAKKSDDEEYGFIDDNDDDYNQEDYNESNEDDYGMDYNDNLNQSTLDNDYIPDDNFVKKEDIEKASILGGYEPKILNSDFEETPESDENITTSFNDENNNKHKKGKRFL